MRNTDIFKIIHKKGFALLLALIFVFTLFPGGTVLAEEPASAVPPPTAEATLDESADTSGTEVAFNVSADTSGTEVTLDEPVDAAEPELTIEEELTASGAEDPAEGEIILEEEDPQETGADEEISLAEGLITYPLWIEGTQVTSENCDGLLWDKSASFDPDTKTLTLNNSSITAARGDFDPEGRFFAGIYSELPELTITSIGENEIRMYANERYTDTEYGIRASRGVIAFNGAGSLRIETVNAFKTETKSLVGISADSVDLSDTNLSIEINDNYYYRQKNAVAIETTRDTVISHATADILAGDSFEQSVGIKTGGSLIFNSGAYVTLKAGTSKGLIAAVYSADTYVNGGARLNISSSSDQNSNLCYGFYSDKTSPNLLVDKEAELTVSSEQAAFSFAPDVSGLTKKICVNTTNSSTNCFAWDNTTSLTAYPYFSYPGTVCYGVYVSGQEITENNYTDVLGDGKISYDPGNKKLYLTDAAIETAFNVTEQNGSNYAGIFSCNDLTIVLEGHNTISITPNDSTYNAYGIVSESRASISHLYFEGSGSLDISMSEGNTSNENYGICATELFINDATISVDLRKTCAENGNRSSFGIYSGDNLRFTNAKITAYAGDTKQSFYSSWAADSTGIYGNSIIISGSEIYSESGNGKASYGFAASSSIRFSYTAKSKLTAIAGESTDHKSIGIHIDQSSGSVSFTNDPDIEAIGNDLAINKTPNFGTSATKAAWVNTEPTAEGQILWDKSTPFQDAAYKYVKIPGADNYAVWVQGTPIDGVNCADVLGDGTVNYEPRSKTLTLNGANLTAVSGDYQDALAVDDRAAIASTHDLNIVLEGENAIALDPSGLVPNDYMDAIYTDGSLNISGSGNLQVAMVPEAALETFNGIIGISAEKSISVTDAVIDINIDYAGTIDIIYGLHCPPSDLTITNANIGINCPGNDQIYFAGLYAGTAVINGISNVNVSATCFNGKGISVEESTLTISEQANVSTAISGTRNVYGISANATRISDDAIVEAIGSTRAFFEAPEISGLNQQTAYVNTQPAAEGRTAWNGSTPLGGSVSTYKYVRLPGEMVYPVFVGGTQITEFNRNDVLGDGSVSFNHQTNTLTLNNAQINSGLVSYEGDDYYCGIAGFTDLKIILKGENTITLTTPEQAGSSLSLCGIYQSDDDHTLDISGTGKLLITEGSIGAGNQVTWINGIFAGDPTRITDAEIQLNLKDVPSEELTGITFYNDATVTNAKIDITCAKTTSQESGIFSLGALTIGGSSDVKISLQDVAGSADDTVCLGFFGHNIVIKDTAIVNCTAGKAAESYAFGVNYSGQSDQIHIKDQAYVTAIGNTRAFETAPDLSEYGEMEAGASLAYVNTRPNERGRRAWDESVSLDDEAAGYKYVRIPGPIPYRIWVEGTEITNDNCADVKGDGSVIYDHDTHTLTLKNADLQAQPAYSSEYVAGILSSDIDLNIVLEGQNTITLTADNNNADVYGIFSGSEDNEPALSISGEGSLAIRSEDLSGAAGIFCGIYDFGHLDITDADVDIQLSSGASNKYMMGIIAKEVSLNGAGITIREGDATDIGGLVSDDLSVTNGSTVSVQTGNSTGENYAIGATYRLLVEGASVVNAEAGAGSKSYGIKAFVDTESSEETYFNIKDTSKITASGQTGAFSADPDFSEYSDPYGTALVNTVASEEGAVPWNGSDSLSNSGFKYVGIPGVPAYPVWVQGVRVNDQNKADVLGDGKISYDAENKQLHLHYAAIRTANAAYGDASYYAGIFSSNDLTVVLEGNNTISITPNNSTYNAYGIVSESRASISHLYFAGSGSLDISMSEGNTSNENYGICATELFINDATISVDLRKTCAENGNRSSFGIYSGDNLSIANAKITAYAGDTKQSFYSSWAADSTGIYGHRIIISGSEIYSESGNGKASYGFAASSSISFSYNTKCKLTAIAGESTDHKSIGIHIDQSSGSVSFTNDPDIEAIGNDLAINKTPNFGTSATKAAWVNTEPTAKGRILWDTTTSFQDAGYKYVRIPAVPVTGISLDTESKLLDIGDTFTLSPTVLPENADDPQIVWSSSDESVATVDENGQVTAVGIGSAVITASAAENPEISATCEVEVTKLITLTIRWSSFDGTDLEEPIIYTDVKAGTTIKDALAAHGTSLNYNFFQKDGYLSSGFELSKPYADCTDWDDLLSSEVKNNAVLNENTDIYICMNKLIETAEITITPPVCGTETFTPKGNTDYDWDKQTNAPAVSVPDGAVYEPDTDFGTLLPAYWLQEYTPSATPFIGKFKGGESYLAKIYLIEKMGYRFSDDAVFKINGADPIEFEPALIASVKAEHVPGEAVKENEIAPTDTAAGSCDEVVYCSGCGEELSRKTVAIPIVPVTKIKLNKTSAEVATKSSLQLKVTFTPSATTQKNITWTSSDPAIASVDKNGKVTAHEYGKPVTITATSTANRKVLATCKIQTRYYDATKTNVDTEKFKAIYWAADNKITGMPVYFGTNSSMTRGQFVRFLHRYAGQPKVTKDMIEKYGSKFTDIDKSYTHYKAIVWAISEGLIGGYSDGSFKPEKSLSRNNVATILWKFAGSKKVKSAANPFKDVKKSMALAWGKSKGIFKADAKGNFYPSDNCLRGDFALFLFRYNNKK